MHVTQCTFPGNGPVKTISCRFLVKISKFLHNYRYTGGRDHKLWRLVLWFYLWSLWYNRSFPQLYSLIGISIASEWCGSWATYFRIPTGWTYDNNDQNMNVSHVLYSDAFWTGDRINTVTAGDNINGMMFSSLDRDNDRHSGGHCALDHSGGWWFNVCHDAYLNGPYGSSSWNQPWHPLLSTGETIKETTMMIRRR